MRIIGDNCLTGFNSLTVKPMLKYAEDEENNLVVVGTRSRTGIKKMLLGSVASGVVTYAHCPLIVVK